MRFRLFFSDSAISVRRTWLGQALWSEKEDETHVEQSRPSEASTSQRPVSPQTRE